MNEARDRFDEAARMILDAARARRDRRRRALLPAVRTADPAAAAARLPRPFLLIGMSPESVEQAASIGARW